MSLQQTPEIPYLNTLRVLAITGVIMVHIFMTMCALFAPVLTPVERYICIVLRNLWHWCVPLFVMISGVLLLDPQRDISLGKLCGKYLLRIMLALCIFGIPYSFAELLVVDGWRFSVKQIGMAFLNVLRGKPNNHLWYLYLLAGLYLIIPILKIFAAYINRKRFGYMLMVLFLFTSVLPLLKNLCAFETGFYIPVNSVYVFFLLAGYYIHHYGIRIPAGILAGIIFLYAGYVIVMSLNSGMLIHEADERIVSLESDSPLVAIISIALFCFFRQQNKTSKLCGFFAPLCFGIYLIHPLFLFSIYLFLRFTPERYPLALVIAGTITGIIGLSTAFTYVARKIRILRKYVL